MASNRRWPTNINNWSYSEITRRCEKFAICNTFQALLQ
ncbi:unnamed protein product [Schistosoma curassoni]|uniref:Uncharacterized protein n=1 Tax=Schistosoma curassoni TaxID=6186 RepID=A0A183JID8_9TREM|nr:unnamed protein product [Schistosoma curassoni]